MTCLDCDTGPVDSTLHKIGHLTVCAAQIAPCVHCCSRTHTKKLNLWHIGLSLYTSLDEMKKSSPPLSSDQQSLYSQRILWFSSPVAFQTCGDRCHTKKKNWKHKIYGQKYQPTYTSHLQELLSHENQKPWSSWCTVLMPERVCNSTWDWKHLIGP